MNRYPVWKYIIILITLVVGVLYTLPNFFGEAPAVQVSAAKATVRVDGSTLSRVESVLQGASITPQRLTQEGTSVWARFDTPDTQLKAKDAIERALNPDAADPSYIVALNLVPRSPAWLAAINAKPMYLGLDLRGGVHFMLQVDMRTAITSAWTRWPTTSALRCAKRTCATVASAARATASRSAPAMPPRWKPRAASSPTRCPTCRSSRRKAPSRAWSPPSSRPRPVH